jgi:hypothetical protein
MLLTSIKEASLYLCDAHCWEGDSNVEAEDRPNDCYHTNPHTFVCKSKHAASQKELSGEKLAVGKSAGSL